jgi:hypothetical protein
LADNFNRQFGTLRRLIAHNYPQEDMGRLYLTIGTEFKRLPGETKLQKVKSALQKYVDDIKQKLKDGILHGKSAGDAAQAQASTRVQDCFTRLDLV